MSTTAKRKSRRPTTGNGKEENRKTRKKRSQTDSTSEDPATPKRPKQKKRKARGSQKDSTPDVANENSGTSGPGESKDSELESGTIAQLLKLLGMRPEIASGIDAAVKGSSKLVETLKSVEETLGSSGSKAEKLAKLVEVVASSGGKEKGEGGGETGSISGGDIASGLELLGVASESANLVGGAVTVGLMLQRTIDGWSNSLDKASDEAKVTFDFYKSQEKTIKKREGHAVTAEEKASLGDDIELSLEIDKEKLSKAEKELQDAQKKFWHPGKGEQVAVLSGTVERIQMAMNSKEAKLKKLEKGKQADIDKDLRTAEQDAKLTNPLVAQRSRAKWMQEYERMLSVGADYWQAEESASLKVFNDNKVEARRVASGMVDARSGAADIARAAQFSLSYLDGKSIERKLDGIYRENQRSNETLSRENFSR